MRLQRDQEAYDRLNCVDDVEMRITVHEYRTVAEAYEAGPATFYFKGMDAEENTLVLRGEGRASLTFSMLVENNGESNLSLFCSGPSFCNYDVWDGSSSFKYSTNDFVSGQIVLKRAGRRSLPCSSDPTSATAARSSCTIPASSTPPHIRTWGRAQIPLDLS